jgi:hypothetical protein
MPALRVNSGTGRPLLRIISHAENVGYSEIILTVQPGKLLT